MYKAFQVVSNISVRLRPLLALGTHNSVTYLIYYYLSSNKFSENYETLTKSIAVSCSKTLFAHLDGNLTPSLDVEID